MKKVILIDVLLSFIFLVMLAGFIMQIVNYYDTIAFIGNAKLLTHEYVVHFALSLVFRIIALIVDVVAIVLISISPTAGLKQLVEEKKQHIKEDKRNKKIEKLEKKLNQLKND